MSLEEKFSVSSYGSAKSEAFSTSVKTNENEENDEPDDLPNADALQQYDEECYKFWSPPIQSVKESIKGEVLLNLKNYGPRNLGVYILCETFAKPPLPPLRQLDLSNCPFDEIGCITLQEFLLQSSTLEHLNLSNCRIGVKGAQILADGIQLSHSITYLNLSHCDLEDEGGAIVFKAMTMNEVCKILDVSHNFLYLQTATEIGNFLKVNEVLQDLNLNWNDLYPQKIGILKVLKGLKVNKSLQKLNLSWNGLMGKLFATELKKCLRGNKSLQVLKLENNLMGTVELSGLCGGLKKSSLKEVYLGGNRWYEAELLELVKILEANKGIEVLSLGEETYLDETAYDLAQKTMSENPNVQIVFKGKIKPNPPEAVDFQNILLDRAKFKAMSPKKKKKRRDFGHLMLKLQELEDEFMKRSDVEEIFEKFKAKLDDDLINHILEEFTESVQVGKKKKKVKRIAIKKLAEKYLERHPTEPAPPTKPPKGKGKKRAKSKNK